MLKEQLLLEKQDYAAPANQIEDQLISIWKALLDN